jgi:hypothetical protein
MRLCILVSGFCLLASVGLGQDVGVDTILAPRGTLDSGQSVIPRCVVANYGDSTVSAWASMQIEQDGCPVYRDSLLLTNLAPSSRETVAFTGWVPTGRDSMTATAWTECAGDTNPQNDTALVKFFIRVKDVAVYSLVLPDTFRVGDTVRLAAWVGNYGNETETFPVRFFPSPPDSLRRVPPLVWVTLLQGHSARVTAPFAWVVVPGILLVGAHAMLPGDMHPENNMQAETVWIRGTIVKDVEAVAVLAPPSVIDTTRTFVPKGRICSHGTDIATFWSFFLIHDAGGTLIYCDSTQHMFLPGESSDVEYDSVRIRAVGSYVAAESVFMVGDQNSVNDCVRKSFRVVAPGGAEEGSPQAASPKPQATILTGASSLGSLARSVIFDATGRRVLHFKPGICFVLPGSGASPGASGVTKVILTR